MVRTGRVRQLLPAALALLLIGGGYLAARLPTASAADRRELAAGYHFTELPIAMPAGYQPRRTVREVNPAFEPIRSWISSVGAGIALADLRGSGRADGICLTDPRTDQVVLSYAPTAVAADRFTPFVLDPAPLPMDATIAPMACTPGDFNQDGRTDLLVTYWGRTPVLFLARAGQSAPSNPAYRRVEVVPTASPDGRYHGQRWNTNAVSVADLDADGHPDLLVANYFPDSGVLDRSGHDDVEMNASMSHAHNGGGAHVLRWVSGRAGTEPDARFVEQPGSVPLDAASGWTLAAASADLTGDGRPEVYLANDFGEDHLLDNRSAPGRIRFTEAIGRRTPVTPKSFVVGRDSFKGMGIDFADLDHDGQFDMLVSNITTAWGLEESNFTWMNEARGPADMRAQLDRGVAPFRQRAQEHGLAWTGWGWDVKTADFRNSGNLDVVQAEGFVKGTSSRWAWLQEMAMNNDDVYTDPGMWPYLRPGDDLSGDQLFAFYATGPDGVHVNINHQLGMTTPIPSRGIAVADTRGTGMLDFAVARQWGPPSFYANASPHPGHYLELHLYRPAEGGPQAGALPGAPAYGTTVELLGPGGHQVSQLDGGGGHSGRRSFEVHFGLGGRTAPVTVRLQWPDGAGGLHRQELSLAPGQHTLVLNGTAEEVPNR